MIKSDPNRDAPIAISADVLRDLGHEIVERLSEFNEVLPDRKVSPGLSLDSIRALLPKGGLPETGTDPGPLVLETLSLLQEHLAFNGHPRFLGIHHGVALTDWGTCGFHCLHA